MKRTLSMLLCALLVLSVPLMASAEEITLWMGSWWEQQAPVIEEKFNSDPANEGTTLKVETFPINGYLDKIIAATLGGNPPDIADVDVTFLGALVRRNLATPYTEEDLEGLDISDFASGAWNAGVIDGVTYAVPNRASSGAFIYNKAIFDKAGLAYPTNEWEIKDYYDMLVKLRDASNGEFYPTAVAVSPADPSNFTTSFDFILWGLGGDYMNAEQTQVTMDTPEAIEAIQLFVDLFKEGLVPEGAINYTLTNDVVPMFTEGKLAMMNNTSSWTTIFQESGVDYGVVLTPGRNNGAGGYTFVVPATAKNPEAAKKFVRWFVQPEIMGELMIRTPSRISVNRDYAPWNEPQNDIFNQANEFSRPIPVIPEFAELRLIMINEMQKAIMGQQTAEQTGKAITEQGNALIAEGAE